METASGWSLIEPDAPEPAKPPSAAVPTAGHASRTLVAALVVAVAAVVGVVIWLTLPTGGVVVDGGDGAFQPNAVAAGGSSAAPNGSFSLVAVAPSLGTLIVDIEGAVLSPGVHALDDGSRVSDAIAAAGGYAPTVDIAAASNGLNLAARVTDGQKIHVPVLGETIAALPTAGQDGGVTGPGSSSGALIDLNHATADELDALPGIGPVTAQKIIDARTEAPFATIDELQTRGVVGASEFEKLSGLITVNP